LPLSSQEDVIGAGVVGEQVFFGDLRGVGGMPAGAGEVAGDQALVDFGFREMELVGGGFGLGLLGSELLGGGLRWFVVKWGGFFLGWGGVCLSGEAEIGQRVQSSVQ